MSSTPAYHEQELLQEVAKGNETAFTTLVNQYKNNLFTSAWRITGSKALAEDILQNVFLNLWLHRERLAGMQNFPGYLYTMTRNAIFDALRVLAKRKEMSLTSDVEHPSFTHVDTENTLQRREYETILHRAIESLPPRQKQTFILIRQEGFKRNETAQAMNVSAETVKFNLEEATRKVRAFCQAHFTTLLVLLALFKKIL